MWKFLISAILYVGIFSLFWTFISSEEFDEFEKFQKTGCSNTFNHTNGHFNLDKHNLSEPCYWIIDNTNKNQSIHLFFFDVFLHENDNLNLYRNLEDAKNNTDPLMEKPIPSQNGTVTLITNETYIVILVSGKDKSFNRIVEGYYSFDGCSVPLAPAVEILYSPKYVGTFKDSVECDYRFNEIQHFRVTQVFTFEEFNMSSPSSVIVEGSTLSNKEYNNDPPTDFFIDKAPLIVQVKLALNSSDHFKLKIHQVDRNCSGKVEFQGDSHQLFSPEYVLNNGSITAYECRWLVEHSPKILGLKFDKLNFASVFDIIAVNDGASEFSLPLLQVTTSNRNMTQNQVIRATQSSMWISFKPLSFESHAVINITTHGQGGYFKNNGSISMKPSTGDDTFFLLEVEVNKVVMLNFNSSLIVPPAAVTIYDGFDTSNVLTTLHGEIKFPILSRSSRMLVTGTKFSADSNHFSAEFKGVAHSCNHMNSLSAENYILSENCNASCLWIIPPQNTSNTALIVYLQYISLKKGDNMKIHKLDANLTELVEVGANETRIPHISVPGDVGIMINITQATCEKNTDKIVLIGHSSYMPGCNYNITPKASDFLQISSPLYPDTYPIFTNCHWDILAPKDSIVHMAFQTLNLAKNHCIKISQTPSEPNKYEGKILPDDLFLSGHVVIDFDSSGCNKTEVGDTLNSDAGFLLNITVADCGAILDGKKNGEFNTTVTGNNTTCIWKVSVPSTKNSVNIISYVVNEKVKSGNYELHVYDGSSVRDSKITNNTEDLALWSRTNTLIFVYKRLNASQPSSALSVKYDSISCNASMLCENKICMHPDWRCNGANECGDYSDERNCAPVPIPPEVKTTGYSATAFWLCLLAVTIIGMIVGAFIPSIYQKYKDSRYRRFQDLDS